MDSSETVKEIYCICRQPYDPSRAMVQCDDCKEWFHYACIGIENKSKEKVYADDFDCPVCIKVMEKEDDLEKLQKFVKNAANIDELYSVLTQLSLQSVKKFILKQINKKKIDILLPINQNSINRKLPDVIIQSVVSFDCNVNNLSLVCKKWNKISAKVKAKELREKYKMIRQQLKTDKEERCLIVEIENMNLQKHRCMKDVLRQFEISKRQIKEYFNTKVAELRSLSSYQCIGCGNQGYDHCFVKCSNCGKELCAECMLRCENVCCDQLEYYCCDDCGQICEDCDIVRCDQCLEYLECEFCDKRVCKPCIVSFQIYADENQWGGMGDDEIVTTHLACKKCYDMER